MNKKSLFAMISTVVLLILAALGGYRLARGVSPQVKFPTSYQNYPNPKPAPLTEPKQVVDVAGLIYAFDVSSNGEMIAIATLKELILYDLKTLKEVHSLPLKGEAYRVQFSPDGTRLATGGIILKYLESGPLHVTVWDTASWKILYEYESEFQGSHPSGALAWSPTNKQIAFSIPERGLSVVDVESGTVLAILEDFLVPPFDLSWSPDGIRLISTGDLGYGLRRWRVDTNQWVRLWDKDLQPAQQVAWSPDGKRIASGHFGGAICIWNTRNNRCEGRIRAHFSSINGLDWSPDGKQLATASGAIRIWDVHTGDLKQGYGFFDGLIYSNLKWVNDKTLATLETSYTLNVRSTIRFWDAETGDVKLAFRGWGDIESVNNGGVAIRLDDMQISKERTVLQISLRMSEINTTLAGEWHSNLTDSDGFIYPLTDITPQDVDWGMTRVYQTVPIEEGKRLILNLRGFPDLDLLPLMINFPETTDVFFFDPAQLQIGDSVNLNQEVYANDYLLILKSAKKASDKSILFEFATDGVYTGAMLESPFAIGTETQPVNEDTFIANLMFDETPNQPFEIRVSQLYYNVFGPWTLEFDVVKTMFAELPPAAATTLPANEAPVFTSHDPIFLEVKELSDTFDASILQQGAGWVHVVNEVITENLQLGQTYPPPYYQEEYWYEIVAEGWVTRSLITHWSEQKNILQQSVSVGAHTLNLTLGEANEFPMYQFSLISILSDLDYALSHGETVIREETVCDDGLPCLLVTMKAGSTIRRAWFDIKTGQQVKLQTARQLSSDREQILFTQNFLTVEWIESPPQAVLDVIESVVFSTP